MFLRMPITMRDISDAGLTLELRCRHCRRVVQIPPTVLIRRFPLWAGFLDVVLRLRCGDDGMVPNVWLVLDDERVGQEAMRRGLDVHRVRRR